MTRISKVDRAGRSISEKLANDTLARAIFYIEYGDQRTLRSSSVMGPVCSGGSAGEGKGELDGDGSSSGSSALPRDHSSSVVSLGTPSLPAGPLSLTDLLISGSCVTPVLGSSHLVAVNATSDAELQRYTGISIEIPLPFQEPLPT